MTIAHEKPPDVPDEELIDDLIAVSVVAKRLAEKLRTEMDKEKPPTVPLPKQGSREAGNRRYHYEQNE